MFQNHRVIADVPLIPGHLVETHLIRVDQGPVRRPASGSSSSSSGSSSGDDDSGGGSGDSLPATHDGYDGAHAHDGDVEDADSDDSVRIVYDSRDHRGEGPGAALIRNLVSFLDGIPVGNASHAFDASFEVILWTYLSTTSSQ